MKPEYNFERVTRLIVLGIYTICELLLTIISTQSQFTSNMKSAETLVNKYRNEIKKDFPSI